MATTRYAANPVTVITVPTRRRRAARRSANPVLMANPRRRRRNAMLANPVLMANPRHGKRRRRRHASNPIILPNSRRRRRRMANPVGNLRAVFWTSVAGLGAGGASYLANKFLISKLVTAAETAGSTVTLGGIGMRAAARIGIGLASAFLMPGQWSAALMGAMSYPVMSELDTYWTLQRTTAAAAAGTATTPTADLEAMLEDYDS